MWIAQISDISYLIWMSLQVESANLRDKWKLRTNCCVKIVKCVGSSCRCGIKAYTRKEEVAICVCWGAPTFTRCIGGELRSPVMTKKNLRVWRWRGRWCWRTAFRSLGCSEVRQWGECEWEADAGNDAMDYKKSIKVLVKAWEKGSGRWSQSDGSLPRHVTGYRMKVNR